MRLADLAQNDGDGLQVFVFQKVSEGLFVHIVELIPNRPTGGTPDFLHDVVDPILAEDLRQHPLGTVYRAYQPTGRGNLLGKLGEQSLDHVRSDIAEAATERSL